MWCATSGIEWLDRCRSDRGGPDSSSATNGLDSSVAVLQDRYYRRNRFGHETSALKGAAGVLFAIELGRNQVLCAVERELSIAAQVPGYRSHPIDVAMHGFRQAFPFTSQHVGNVVQARRVDAVASQQSLERQLDRFLRFTNDIGLAPGPVQEFDGLQAYRRTSNVVGCQSPVVHRHASSAQYSVP